MIFVSNDHHQNNGTGEFVVRSFLDLSNARLYDGNQPKRDTVGNH